MDGGSGPLCVDLWEIETREWSVCTVECGQFPFPLFLMVKISNIKGKYHSLLKFYKNLLFTVYQRQKAKVSFLSHEIFPHKTVIVLIVGLKT